MEKEYCIHVRPIPCPAYTCHTCPIATPLLAWYDNNKRDLPWRQNTDPYRVWVSEIMLQQTRVAAVIPYFERWMQALPDAAALAAVDDEQLMKLWQGLGKSWGLSVLAPSVLWLQTPPRTLV